MKNMYAILLACAAIACVSCATNSAECSGDKTGCAVNNAQKSAAKPATTPAEKSSDTGKSTVVYTEENSRPVVYIWGQCVRGNACQEPQNMGKRMFLRNVSKPKMELFLTGKPGSGFVVICPGGGYSFLSMKNEGYEIAEYLNSLGVSAGILCYRVPDNTQGALMDVQRAIRIVRANAKKWGVNPDKIAVMGFSAGADLSARISTQYNRDWYEKLDGIDRESARPDATVLVYPAYLDAQMYRMRWVERVREDLQVRDYTQDYALSPHLNVDKNTPPAFIVQTLDDKSCKNSSIAYFLALKDAGVDANLYYCDKGGHGYGLAARKTDTMVSMWPKLLAKYLQISGFLPGQK